MKDSYKPKREDERRIGGNHVMPTPQKVELYHPPTARFQTGNRVYRIVLLGQGGVGKSALTLQFVTHTFQEDHDPTIEDAYQKQAVVDGHAGILDVLDTAGQDEFTAMREQYMRGGEGFILVYSVAEQRSFDEIRRFKEAIDRVRNYGPVPVVIVGNKKDLERKRQVPTSVGEALGKELGCPFFETSAALRQNVDEVFYEIVRCIRGKELEEYRAEHTADGKKRSKSGGSGGLLCCVSGET